MPSPSRNTWWLDAKWLVMASAIAAFAVVLGYDVRLGIATGVLLMATGFAWLLLALWFAAGARAQASPVRSLTERYQQQLRQRMLAEQRARESKAKALVKPGRAAKQP